MGRVEVNFFKEMFTLSNPTLIQQVLRDFQARVTSDMNVSLEANYTEHEIRVALGQMHPIKALNPDGMCPMFFQSYWHIVGPLVTSTVMGILRGNLIPAHINRTFITRIPMKSNPDCMKDFPPSRYVTGCMCKLISKVLANHRKVFLDKIVFVNQSAFTPGRFITDNILVAFEMFHHMKHMKAQEGGVTVKLDMSKTYDRVEWDFIDVVMARFGFDTGWSNRVMDCVRSVSFSMLVAALQMISLPHRDIHQGDPLSPYLFFYAGKLFLIYCVERRRIVPCRE